MRLADVRHEVGPRREAQHAVAVAAHELLGLAVAQRVRRQQLGRREGAEAERAQQRRLGAPAVARRRVRAQLAPRRAALAAGRAARGARRLVAPQLGLAAERAVAQVAAQVVQRLVVARVLVQRRARRELRAARPARVQRVGGVRRLVRAELGRALRTTTGSVASRV